MGSEYRRVPAVALAMAAAAMSTLASARSGPGEAQAEEASADVSRDTQWLEVVPAPVPVAEPLAGPDGVDAAGYPRRFVDWPALRSLLLNRRFSRLTAVLEKFQAEFEDDPRYEERVADAFGALGAPHRRELELIEAWVAETPGSFAPHLARARYWRNSGFASRGTKYAQDTSETEFGAMAQAFDRARADLRRARSLRPGLVVGSGMAIELDAAGGSRARAAREMEDALVRCPTCYGTRVAWLWALEPRWGGSLEEMREFAARRADARNPRHRLLPGFVDVELAAEASRDHRDADALTALDRACALGDGWRFFLERSVVKNRLGDRDGALRDAERANGIHGGLPAVLLQRARGLAAAHLWEESGRDLLYVLRSEPTSRHGAELYPHVVGSLDSYAWKEWESGRREVAVGLYALARDLAPRNRGIAQRSAYVAAGRKPPVPRGDGGTPASAW